MEPLSPGELLVVWERGAGVDTAGRVAALLTAAATEEPPGDVAELPVGRGDLRLLELRERICGEELDGWWNCPGCGERLELAFSTADLRRAAREEQPEAPSERTMSVGDHRVTFRLPIHADLACLSDGDTVDEARAVLVRRCILEAYRGSVAVVPSALPPEVVDAVEADMAEADPLADLWLRVDCPRCGATGAAPFDIGSFLWEEIAARARSLVDEVHVLASAYGWSEGHILAMTTRRRRAYLELAGT